jgi:hypothetical protein
MRRFTPTVVPAVLVGAERTLETSAGDPVFARLFFIAGMTFAALLLLLAAAVPETPVRFTAPGRVVMHHQTDLVLAGIGTLLLTAMLLLITGSGP